MTKQTEEITYHNTDDNIAISGTLTLPDKNGPFPTVFLISGMGAHDRDYTAVAHKLFLVISNYLSDAGIAVLRVDKRGVGMSTGKFDTSVTSEDLARDVLAGVAYLKTRKEIDSKRIGLIGHSEGGMIAAMVASQSDDIAFLVTLAGVATTAVKDVLAQVAQQLKADGASDELIFQDTAVREKLLLVVRQEHDVQKTLSIMQEILNDYFMQLPKELKAESEKLVFAIKESQAEMVISFFNSPAYRYWLQHNPADDFSRITIPVLAVNGDLDFVTASDLQLPIIRAALKTAGNEDVAISEKSFMNHWLQRCSSGSIAEYGQLKESIAPEVLQLIADWINARFGNKN